MAFRLKLREPVADGIVRIGREQLREAAAALAEGTGRATAVHDARKCLKRLRALVSAAQPGLGRRTYRDIRACISTAARRLGPTREAAVMRQTLARLADHYDLPPAGAVGRVGAALKSPRALDEAVAVASARPALDRLAKAFEQLVFEKLTLDDIAAAMGAVLATGRHRFERAFDTGDDEAMHDWRKVVQLHWRHMALVSDAWPDAFQVRIETAKRLSHLAGEDNDLATLVRAVAAPAAKFREVDRAVIVAICRVRQGELRRITRPLGERLFAIDAAALDRTIVAAWRTAPLLQASESKSSVASGQIVTLVQ